MAFQYEGDMMKKLHAIGEMLIDFIPQEKGTALKDVISFEKAPGGAPANVAAAVAKYGAPSRLITKLGKDAFGDFLIETVANLGVDTSHILRTDKANTGLAFVALSSEGERQFTFYRNPSADLLLEADELDEESFGTGDYLHFCSVDLVESPMKAAHKRAIELVKAKQGIISFDPNVRLPLWESEEACRAAILEFLPLAHIVKISDEELTFITGIEEEAEALRSLFRGDVEVVVYTQGGAGATVITKQFERFGSGYQVQVADTTGAGDAFIGGFLFKLLEQNVETTNLTQFVEQYADELLAFANASGALTTTQKGGISALPTVTEIEAFIKKR
jgi:fructokinase